MQDMKGMSRRGFASAGAAAALGGLGAVGTKANIIVPRGKPAGDMALSRVASEFMFFEDPDEAFRQYLRMERDLVETQGTAMTWYH